MIITLMYSMSEKDQGPQVLHSRNDPDSQAVHEEDERRNDPESHAVHEEDERRARALNELIRL